MEKKVCGIAVHVSLTKGNENSTEEDEKSARYQETKNELLRYQCKIIKGQKNFMKQCYNCGNYFEDKEITAEHIPAKNLFTGYSDEFKKNRLTVNGCGTCNHGYSNIDQEIRDAIGIMNDNNESQNEMTEKAIRSILRKKDGVARLRFSHSEKTLGVEFNYGTLVALHKKHFKALFYERYGQSIDEDQYNIQVICEGDEDNQEAMSIYGKMFQYLTVDGEWKVSGHEDIFQYRIKSISDNGQKYMVDTLDLNKTLAVTAVMVYHKNLCAVVIATRKDYLEIIMPKSYNGK